MLSNKFFFCSETSAKTSTQRLKIEKKSYHIGNNFTSEFSSNGDCFLVPKTILYLTALLECSGAVDALFSVEYSDFSGTLIS